MTPTAVRSSTAQTHRQTVIKTYTQTYKQPVDYSHPLAYRDATYIRCKRFYPTSRAALDPPVSNVHIQRITHLVASLDWFHLCAKGGGEVTVRPLSSLTHWDTCGGGVKPTCQCTLHNMSQNIPVRILYVPVYFDTKGTDSHNPKISTLNFN